METGKRKRNRTGVVALLLLLGCGILAGCGTKAKHTEEKPELIIGITMYEPYVYKNVKGDYAGIDVELMKEACARSGFEPVLKEIDISERFSSLADGSVDCLWSALTMDGRENEYLWVGPYLYAQRIAVVPLESDINTLEDLEDKRVSVQAGSTSEEIIINGLNPDFPQLKQLTTFNSVGEVFAALRKGYVDAAAGLEGALQVYMTEYPGEYRSLSMSLRSEALGVAFRKQEDEEVAQKLSLAFREMIEDGTTAQIIESYGLDVEKNVYGGSNHGEND